MRRKKTEGKSGKRAGGGAVMEMTADRERAAEAGLQAGQQGR